MYELQLWSHHDSLYIVHIVDISWLGIQNMDWVSNGLSEFFQHHTCAFPRSGSFASKNCMKCIAAMGRFFLCIPLCVPLVGRGTGTLCWDLIRTLVWTAASSIKAPFLNTKVFDRYSATCSSVCSAFKWNFVIPAVQASSAQKRMLTVEGEPGLWDCFHTCQWQRHNLLFHLAYISGPLPCGCIELPTSDNPSMGVADALGWSIGDPQRPLEGQCARVHQLWYALTQCVLCGSLSLWTQAHWRLVREAPARTPSPQAKGRFVGTIFAVNQ